MEENLTLREKIHEIIFEADTPAGKLFDVTLLWLIVISVVVVMLESVKHFDILYHTFFVTTEWVLTILFSIEYFLRIIAIKKSRNYIFSFYGVIDFLSILPTYLSLFLVGTQTLAIIRILRLFRVFRIFKLTRYMTETSVLMVALKNSRRKISVFVGGMVLLVSILGAIMYLVEGNHPEAGYDNIPISIYWAIVTITTVGYGDISPVTPFGQFIASVIMLVGYGIIAVPTGIVSAELSKAAFPKTNTQSCSNCNFNDHADDAKFCKKCGESLHL